MNLLVASGDIGNYTAPTSSGVLSESTNIIEIISNATTYLLSITGGVATIALIIAGIMWAMAAGDEEKISRAKSLIKYTIIGLIVALLSFGIVKFLADTFASS